MSPNKRWRIKEQFVDPLRISKSYGVPLVIAKILATRELSFDQIPTFLNPKLDALHSPLMLNDIEIAIYRIKSAIDSGERIFIHGDYDVDGVTSLALLYRNLKRLGASDIITYIPDRFEEGYGLSEKGIREAKAHGAKLIITVDCGITAFKEIRLANKLGIDVIVTDHHEPKDELPEALAVVNPKLGRYPFKELAGVGVTFKLLEAFYDEFDIDKKALFWDLDLVALGTVADVVPILDENRIFTKFGLKVLENTKKVGLLALRQVAHLNGSRLKTWHISFVLGPRLNASGRLTHARKALELLITRSGERAIEIAKALDAENRNRQSIEKVILQEAIEFVENNIDLDKNRILVIGKDGWHEGVIGIVASRLAERYNRPTVLVSFKNGTGKGSARSIRNFHLYNALKQVEELLLAFGGHKYAAGLKVERKLFRKLQQELNRIALNSLSENDLLPELAIDAEVSFYELGRRFSKYYEKLEPFGYGNPIPTFLTRGVEVIGKPRIVGDRHLALTLANNGVVREAIMFRGAERIGEVWDGAVIDVVFQIKDYELKLLDFKPSENQS